MSRCAVAPVSRKVWTGDLVGIWTSTGAVLFTVIGLSGPYLQCLVFYTVESKGS